MMDGAYFTGRKDILVWINQTLGLGLSKIEQTCTGAIACQLIDAHFPGNVTMNKLNWEAKNDYEVCGCWLGATVARTGRQQERICAPRGGTGCEP